MRKRLPVILLAGLAGSVALVVGGVAVAEDGSGSGSSQELQIVTDESASTDQRSDRSTKRDCPERDGRGGTPRDTPSESPSDGSGSDRASPPVTPDASASL